MINWERKPWWWNFWIEIRSKLQAVWLWDVLTECMLNCVIMHDLERALASIRILVFILECVCIWRENQELMRTFVSHPWGNVLFGLNGLLREWRWLSVFLGRKNVCRTSSKTKSLNFNMIQFWWLDWICRSKFIWRKQITAIRTSETSNSGRYFER